MNKQVVIARYDEDLMWIRDLKCPYQVYNKGGQIVPSPFPPWYDAVELPNIGREGHTYLYHINQNYDDLAKTTVFVQGNPFVHLGHQFDFIKEVSNLDPDKVTFRPFGRRICCNKFGQPQHIVCKIPFEKCWNKMFPGEGKCPEWFTFTPGAMFSVHKDLILKRNKVWYERAMALTHSHYLQLIYWRWFVHLLERTWPIIFLGKGKSI